MLQAFYFKEECFGAGLKSSGEEKCVCSSRESKSRSPSPWPDPSVTPHVVSLGISLEILYCSELTVTAQAPSLLDASTHLKQKTDIFIPNYINISSKGVKFLSPFWFDIRIMLPGSASFHYNRKPISVLCVLFHSDRSRFEWGSNWKYSHIIEFFGVAGKRVRSRNVTFLEKKRI